MHEAKVGRSSKKKRENQRISQTLFIVHRWLWSARTLQVNTGASQPLSLFTNDVTCASTPQGKCGRILKTFQKGTSLYFSYFEIFHTTVPKFWIAPRFGEHRILQESPIV